MWHYLAMLTTLKMPKILISTGIYPPAIGGPAEYAKSLESSFKAAGLAVWVKTYNIENKLPTGIRHIYYFFKIIPSALWADYIISLDTFSVGLPTTFASKLFGKKNVIRTGGDFLWESFVERTGREVLLKDFYNTSRQFLSLKEKVIFHLTKYVFRATDAIIWSTPWQRNIFLKPYGLETQKHFIVENFYGPKQESNEPIKKVFLASTRNLKWKNHSRLGIAFEKIKTNHPEIILDTAPSRHDEFIEKIKNCYAVILVSHGDISPNMILEAISYNKPFILTKETGLYDKLKDIAVFVDPLDENDIAQKITYLLDGENYQTQLDKIRNFNFTHTYDQIASEFLYVFQKITK